MQPVNKISKRRVSALHRKFPNIRWQANFDQFYDVTFREFSSYFALAVFLKLLLCKSIFQGYSILTCQINKSKKCAGSDDVSWQIPISTSSLRTPRNYSLVQTQMARQSWNETVGGSIYLRNSLTCLRTQSKSSLKKPDVNQRCSQHVSRCGPLFITH